MATCVNCTSDADYTYDIAAGYVQEYCSAHLPKFLYPLKKAGLLRPASVVLPPEPVVEEVVAEKTSKKKTAPVTEEAAPTEE